jgi:hypothetical protein
MTSEKPRAHQYTPGVSICNVAFCLLLTVGASDASHHRSERVLLTHDDAGVTVFQVAHWQPALGIGIGNEMSCAIRLLVSVVTDRNYKHLDFSNT